MPIHDWTRAGTYIFHDFHGEWIIALKHALNRAFRGSDYYALVERGTGMNARQKSVVVRHVTEERPVAVLEVVSPGNKDSRIAFDTFVAKVQNLIAAGVNVSLVDLF